MYIVDIVVGVVLFYAFVTGLSAGFLRKALGLIGIVLAAWVTLTFPSAFTPLLSKIPVVKSSPHFQLLVILALVWILYQLVAAAIVSLVGHTVVFNNFLMKIFGGLLNVTIYLAVFAFVLVFLRSQGFTFIEDLPGFSTSYTKQVIDFLDQSFAVSELFKEFSATVQASLNAAAQATTAQ